MGSEDENKHQAQGCLDMEIEQCRSQHRGLRIAAGHLACGDSPSDTHRQHPKQTIYGMTWERCNNI